MYSSLLAAQFRKGLSACSSIVGVLARTRWADHNDDVFRLELTLTADVEEAGGSSQDW